MIIKPSAEIRNNYRKLADFCIETGEPVFLTNNGEGELVVMSIDAWKEERYRIRIEQAIQNHEEREAAEAVSYTSASDFIAGLRGIVNKAADNE